MGDSPDLSVPVIAIVGCSILIVAALLGVGGSPGPLEDPRVTTEYSSDSMDSWCMFEATVHPPEDGHISILIGDQHLGQLHGSAVVKTAGEHGSSVRLHVPRGQTVTVYEVQTDAGVLQGSSVEVLKDGWIHDSCRFVSQEGRKDE